MRVVSIIHDGSIVKNHDEYPITQSGWKLVNTSSLYEYLKTELGIRATGTIGVSSFYVRDRRDGDVSMCNMDPWGRKFKESCHRVYTDTVTVKMTREVYLHKTTVNGFDVYCVDILYPCVKNDN